MFYKDNELFIKKINRVHPINSGTKNNPTMGEYYGPVYYCESCGFGKNEDEIIIESFKRCPGCGSILIWNI